MGHATMPGTTFYNMQCPQQHESQYHDLNDYHQQSDDADSTASTLSSDETEDIMHQREQQQNFNRHGHAQYTYWDQTLPNQTPGHAQPQPRPQPQPQAWHETMWTPNHQREYVKHLYQTQNGTSWQETPPQWAGSEPKAQAQIVHVGEGTTVAGQRSEDFADSAQVSLCYQCCKHMPLRTLMSIRDESCGDDACRRTEEAGVNFIPMPQDAAEPCEDFQTFLVWWMDKVELGVPEPVMRLARGRVEEMRAHIPDVAPVES